MSTISRRSFVSGAVAAGAVAASAQCATAGTAFAVEAANDAPSTAADYEKPWSFEIAPEPIDLSTVRDTVEADVVVVGAGTSGLVCALSALQEGLSVCVISRSAEPVARGGSNFAVYSTFMESLGAPRMDVERELRSQLLMNSFNVDTRKWYRFYNESEHAMNWLLAEIAAEDDGWEPELETAGWGFPEDDPMRMPVGTHGWTDGTAKGSQGQPHVVAVLRSHIEDAGGRIDWLTTAKQLVRGGIANGLEGRVEAVVAQAEDGSYVEYIGKKAVVLATGDFSADRDMIAKYAPLGLDLFLNWNQDLDPDIAKVYGGLYKGDGHKMGLWVGAAWQRTKECPIMYSSAKGQGVGKPQVMLDKTGKRFWAEERTEGMLGQVQQHCPDKTYYNVWSTNFAEDYPYFFASYGAEKTPAETTIASWESQVEKGTVVKADTIEELVAALELPQEAVAEIERYNGFCENGLDEDFYKRSEFLIGLAQPPFYGIKIDSFTVLTVLGGLRTNQYMQVCADDDTPIEGLYNVGTMVGDVFANAYTFQVPGFCLGMNCITFGYLTGKYIAQAE